MERMTRKRFRWSIASMMLAIALVAFSLRGYLQIKRDMARRDGPKTLGMTPLTDEMAKDLGLEVGPTQIRPVRPIDLDRD
jgi:hypothetical protein